MERRKKERRQKVSVNNGQVNAWTNIVNFLISLPSMKMNVKLVDNNLCNYPITVVTLSSLLFTNKSGMERWNGKLDFKNLSGILL